MEDIREHFRRKEKDINSIKQKCHESQNKILFPIRQDDFLKHPAQPKTTVDSLQFYLITSLRWVFLLGGDFVPPMGHLAMSGDTGCEGDQDATSI